MQWGYSNPQLVKNPIAPGTSIKFPRFPLWDRIQDYFSASGPPLALMSLWVLLKKIRGRLRDTEGSIILPEPVESGATQGNKNFEAKGQTIAEESVYPQVIGRTVR